MRKLLPVVLLLAACGDDPADPVPEPTVVGTWEVRAIHSGADPLPYWSEDVDPPTGATLDSAIFTLHADGSGSYLEWWTSPRTGSWDSSGFGSYTFEDGVVTMLESPYWLGRETVVLTLAGDSLVTSDCNLPHGACTLHRVH